MALASVLAVLLAVNLLTNRLAPGLYLPTCVVAAAALLLIARRPRRRRSAPAASRPLPDVQTRPAGATCLADAQLPSTQ